MHSDLKTEVRSERARARPGHDGQLSLAWSSSSPGHSTNSRLSRDKCCITKARFQESVMKRHQHQFHVTDTLLQISSRRSHRKSRTGCLNCKRLHIKCSEGKPHCRRCLSRGDVCQYTTSSKPQSSDYVEYGQHQTASLAPSAGLSAVSASFTLHDLKLFHHFLCFAHPPLPLGSKVAWTREIPQLSHHTTYLMSALLALAASHMKIEDPGNGGPYSALFHRGHAMTGLREACAKRHHSATDYDVMLATCYALTFQSALLPVDDSDFATFIRGCAMITERIQVGRCPSVFNNLLPNSRPHSEQHTIAPRLGMAFYPEGSRLPVLLSKGILSLRAVETCLGEQYQGMNVLVSLQSIFSALQTSPSAGYEQFVNYYAVWFKLAEDRLVFSGKATDTEAQLLWVFFIALQLFTALVVVDGCRHETHQRRPAKVELSAVTPKLTGMIEWLHAVEALAPLSLRKHFVWLRLVSDEVIFQIDMVVVTEAGTLSKVAALCNLAFRAHNVFGEVLELSASLANWTEDLVVSRCDESGINSNQITSA